MKSREPALSSGSLACLALVSALLVTVDGASSWTDKLDHGPGRKGFPTFKSGTELLDSWVQKHPSLLTKQTVGHSIENRPIQAYILCLPPSPEQPKKPQVLLTSLMHAREPAGLTVLLYFLGHILELYSAGDAQAQYFIAAREIWFLPFVNPDGYVANEKSTGGYVRKNRRPTPCRRPRDGGVDINRNFGVHWRQEPPFTSCKEDYEGKAPFSEPETRAFKKVCDDNDFMLAMNFHSFGQMLTHPFNWAKDSSLPKDTEEIYKEISKVFKWNRFGPAIRTVGYTTSGESDDWMYGEKHIISMSPEVGEEQDNFWPPSKHIKGIDEELFPCIAYGVKKAGLEAVASWKAWRQEDDSSFHFELQLRNKGLSASLGHTMGLALSGLTGPVQRVQLVKQEGEQQQRQLWAATLCSHLLVQMQPLQRRSSTVLSFVLDAPPEAAGDPTAVPSPLQLCVGEAPGTSQRSTLPRHDSPPPVCQCFALAPRLQEGHSEAKEGLNSAFRQANDELCAAALFAVSGGGNASRETFEDAASVEELGCPTTMPVVIDRVDTGRLEKIMVESSIATKQDTLMLSAIAAFVICTGLLARCLLPRCTSRKQPVSAAQSANATEVGPTLAGKPGSSRFNEDGTNITNNDVEV